MILTDLLKKNRVFYLTFLLIWLVTGTLMLLYTKGQLIHWVNDHYNVWTDLFFDYATYLGDGAFFGVVIVVMFFLARRLGELALASFAVSSLLSVFFKQVVFPGRFRPLKYFEHSRWEYHLIKGLKIHEYNSFPSGHTISAFTLFGMLALLDTRKNWGWFWALLAATVGYSRVYLFQHFVEDAFAGALIGVLSITGVYWAFTRWRPIDTASV